MNKKQKNKKNFEPNFCSSLIRNLDIYGQPLQWYIGSDKKYTTIVGGTRSFLVISCALIFLIYSILKLFHHREGSFVFYDIVEGESGDIPFIYYKDFEIFFYFQKANRRFMRMDNELLQVTLGETYTTSECSSSSEESENRRNLKKISKKKSKKNLKRKLSNNNGPNHSGGPNNHSGGPNHSGSPGPNNNSHSNNNNKSGSKNSNDHFNNNHSHFDSINHSGNQNENSHNNYDNSNNNDDNDNKKSSMSFNSKNDESHNLSDNNKNSNSKENIFSASNDNSQNSENNFKSEFDNKSNNKNEDSSNTKEDNKISNNDSQNNFSENKEKTDDNNQSKISNFNENNNDNLKENSFDNNKEENMNNNEKEPKEEEPMNKEESDDSCTETTTTLANYVFYECDANYFKKELHFSQKISEQFSQSYCLNKSQYNSKINFTLSQVNPLGESNYELLFKFNQACLNEKCDSKTNDFHSMIESIQTVKIFIKTYIPDPNNLENPIQSQINTFTLSPNHRGTTLYFKKYRIKTDSSIIPYIIKPKEFNFVAFDYYEDNAEESLTNTFFLRFVLSNNNSYLFRSYEKLDTILANFIGVLNALEFVGRFLSIIFYSFYNEIYIYNYILKDKIFFNENCNNNIIIKKKFNIYNTNINSNFKKLFIKINKENNFELKNLEKNNKKILCLNKLNNNDISSSENDSNTFELKKKDNFNKTKDNSISFLSNNIDINKLNLIKIKNEKNNIENIKNNNDFIKLSFIQNLYTVILISCNNYHSKYKDIDIILKKIKLVQNLYDTAIYLNNIFDVMKIKKILFNQETLLLINSMPISFDEVNKYINIMQNNEEFINKNQINEKNINRKNLTKIIRYQTKNNINNNIKNNEY